MKAASIEFRKHLFQLCRFEDIADKRLGITYLDRAVKLLCLDNNADKQSDRHTVDEHQLLKFKNDVFLNCLQVRGYLLEKVGSGIRHAGEGAGDLEDYLFVVFDPVYEHRAPFCGSVDETGVLHIVPHNGEKNNLETGWLQE
jgi:hypothetical protein